MGSVATVVFTLVVDYTIQASLVGATVAWLLLLRDQQKLRLPGILALVALFAALDLLWYPGFLAMDATVTIGNEAVAELLGLEGPISAGDFVGASPFDLPIWIAQAIVALVTAQLLLHWRAAA